MVERDGRKGMRNAENRENERDDKFPRSHPDRWGTASESRKRTGIHHESPAPGKLRRTIYRFIAIPAVIVFPWNEIGWKIPWKSEEKEKKELIRRRFGREESQSFAGRNTY